MRARVQGLPDERTGWLAGLRDPAVSRVLAMMHGDLACAWSVEELSRRAGLSRSGLGERFTRLIGVSPMLPRGLAAAGGRADPVDEIVIGTRCCAAPT